MNLLAILRRHLCILRQVQSPHFYPSKQKILDRLHLEEVDAVSVRTLERDLRDIEGFYGVKIKFDRNRRGYFLDQPNDEDVSDFQHFFQLLERCERLAFLTHASDALSISKYLLLEENDTLAGLENLPVLWEALRGQLQITFNYKTFQAEEAKSYLVDPLVLLEYRNRWYLAAFDKAVERFKTFGLERMQEPQLTKDSVLDERRATFLALKKDALGVFISPEDKVERVLLKVSNQREPYLRTVPLHSSQKIIQEGDEGIIMELSLIVNPELEREILGYGEHIEVLEPEWLREKIINRIDLMNKNYKYM